MVTTTVVVTLKLILTGLCLGIGFWLGRKLTDWLDILMFTSSNDKMAKLMACV